MTNYPATLPDPTAWNVPGGHGLADDELVAMAQYGRAIGEPASAADYGFLGWSVEIAFLAFSTALTSGAQYFMKMWVPRSITVTNMHCFPTTTGSGLTAGANNMGIYNSAGTQIGATADITAYTTGLTTAALTSSLPITGGIGVFVWLAMKCTGTTTPSMARSGGAADVVTNANLTTANYRSFTNGTVTNALLPGSITLASSVRQINIYGLACS